MTKGNMTEIQGTSVSHAESHHVGDVVDGNSKTSTSERGEREIRSKIAKGEG